MLLGLYLATGQDGANIVEGSQGITHVRVENSTLYFSCTLPSIIVGTVGHGKDLPQVQENLRLLGCMEPREIGANAARLAAITAATVLCGEISLMAALTCPGELMKAHDFFERSQVKRVKE
jgi:hydroxymethylglutaryl-CoA reductase (NADPH)